MIDQIFKSLSDRNRLKVVAALIQINELCACQLTELLGVSGATCSKHVNLLIKAGLVESRKEGRWVYYSLISQSKKFTPLIQWITTELKNDTAMQDAIKQLDTILEIAPEELCRIQRNEQCCENP